MLNPFIVRVVCLLSVSCCLMNDANCSGVFLARYPALVLLKATSRFPALTASKNSLATPSTAGKSFVKALTPQTASAPIPPQTSTIKQPVPPRISQRVRFEPVERGRRDRRPLSSPGRSESS